MWEWLAAPIDPTRAHAVGWAVSWHGRSMALAWGLLAPLAVVAARYFKVMPGQDWPRELDNQTWWRSHWIGQLAVLGLTALGLGLIWSVAQGGSLHGRLGYAVVILLIAQVALGYFRGSKGGPTAPELRGDHYDMTPWRRMFELVHKSAGYLLLILGAVTVATGLWHANAPRWMWAGIGLYWGALFALALIFQRLGWAIDTYQAIWGPSEAHPGNLRPARGWGMRRLKTGESENVRSH